MELVGISQRHSLIHSCHPLTYVAGSFFLARAHPSLTKPLTTEVSLYTKEIESNASN